MTLMSLIISIKIKIMIVVFYDLKKKLDNWIDNSDYGNMTESKMIKEMWKMEKSLN